MTFTSDQYSQIARGYDKAAADPFVPKDKRAEFAKKAEWFHYLSAREKETEAVAYGGSEEASSERPRRSVGALLTTLWLTGAALYLISTLLFTNAVGLFGDDDKPTPVGRGSQPVGRSLQTASVADKEKAGESAERNGPAAERPHAISPDQPAYEAPGLMVPSPVTEQEDTALPVSPQPTEQASAPPASTSESEILKVTKTATIRNGPSATSKIIGTAIPGAELQVKSRENGWIEFIDPSSGNSGWIQSDLVASTSPEDQTAAAVSKSEQAQSVTPQKPTPIKKGLRQKPPSKVAQPRPSEPSSPRPAPGYAELPDDEDFLADRATRRKGLFARRRMLREGLMSPGFLPPQ
jgi:hypothetical protein